MQCKKQCKEKMSFAQDYTLFTQCLLQFKQSYTENIRTEKDGR